MADAVWRGTNGNRGTAVTAIGLQSRHRELPDINQEVRDNGVRAAAGRYHTR